MISGEFTRIQKMNFGGVDGIVAPLSKKAEEKPLNSSV
jgi:hypothetical protein